MKQPMTMAMKRPMIMAMKPGHRAQSHHQAMAIGQHMTIAMKRPKTMAT